MYIETLERVGLTGQEAKIYLSLLKNGISKTGDILKNSGINTGKIYEILEGMKMKGLVSESIVNNVRHFSANRPESILDFVEEKSKRLKIEKAEIEGLLPELNSMKSQEKKVSTSMIFKGFRGFRNAILECYGEMRAGEEILGMGVGGFEDDKRINDFWMNFSTQRSKSKIKTRMIFSEDKRKLSQVFRKFKNTEIRVLEGVTPVTVSILGEDKVLIMSYEDVVTCTVIRDKNTASSFKVFFEGLWKKSKSIN
jgi:sugar-specific transcriptional regulator TrmB